MFDCIKKKKTIILNMKIAKKKVRTRMFLIMLPLNRLTLLKRLGKNSSVLKAKAKR